MVLNHRKIYLGAPGNGVRIQETAEEGISKGKMGHLAVGTRKEVTGMLTMDAGIEHAMTDGEQNLMNLTHIGTSAIKCQECHH